MHRVAIASGKGGVGKSTVAAQLALALRDTGQKVGLLDADLYGPDLPRMFGLTRRRAAAHVTLGGEGVRLAPYERFGVEMMSSQFLVSEDQPLAWESPLAGLLLDRFVDRVAWSPDLDYLVVDLPPGTADVQLRLARTAGLDGAIVVVTPQDVAHLDAKKLLTMLAQAKVRVIGGIENMAYLACPDCARRIDVFPPTDPERSIWATGVERLASVPVDAGIAAATERGEVVPPFPAVAGRLTV